jgi:hypothetical protein
VHPIERLRWIARADGESAATIASEAAWTLGELGAEEPAAVLTASRRLVERHRSSGPLWWVCAHMVASDDPLETAHRISAELYSDAVPDRVADALRIEFTSSDVLCSTSPSETFQQALSRRGTYIVRLIGGYRSLRRDMRSLGSVVAEATGYEVEEASEALEGANVLLVEPCFAGGAGLFVEPEVASVVELASRLEVPVWALLGAGRVLSSQLAETAADLAGDELELVAPMVVSRAVDCNGIGDLRAALGRASCPPGTELVHRIGR